MTGDDTKKSNEEENDISKEIRTSGEPALANTNVHLGKSRIRSSSFVFVVQDVSDFVSPETGKTTNSFVDDGRNGRSGATIETFQSTNSVAVFFVQVQEDQDEEGKKDHDVGSRDEDGDQGARDEEDVVDGELELFRDHEVH